MQIPKNEKFIDFIFYNDLKDVGFNPKELFIETACVFCFLS